MTLKCTLDLFINVLSSALFCTMFVIKYISFSVNIENVCKMIIISYMLYSYIYIYIYIIYIDI